jgi:hypothetical protein
MPSRKRTVKYNENTEPDGDRNVEVSEEQSVNDDTNTQEEVSESEDERYSPSAGN